MSTNHACAQVPLVANAHAFGHPCFHVAAQNTRSYRTTADLCVNTAPATQRRSGAGAADTAAGEHARNGFNAMQCVYALRPLTTPPKVMYPIHTHTFIAMLQ